MEYTRNNKVSPEKITDPVTTVHAERVHDGSSDLSGSIVS